VSGLVRQWVVTFEGEKPGPADDVKVSFVDIIEVLGEIPVLKEMFLDRLLERIKESDNYYTWSNIKSVVPPEEIELGLEQYYIILGVDKEGRKYGLLMILTGKGVVLGGIWPVGLAEAIKEDKELLNGLLFTLLEKPDFWQEVVFVYAMKKEE